jgi:hypothetical protein
MEKTEHDESERMVVFFFCFFFIWFLMGKNLSKISQHVSINYAEGVLGNVEET